VSFNVSLYKTWSEFICEVDKCPELAIFIIGSDEEGCEYFVETDLDKPAPEFEFSDDMEGFFAKLQTEEEVGDKYLHMIEKKLYAHAIGFNRLMASGEFAVTDEKLLEYGIKQWGLRTAVLSVIKSYSTRNKVFC
jgi:hypothetical protein